MRFSREALVSNALTTKFYLSIERETLVLQYRAYRNRHSGNLAVRTDGACVRVDLMKNFF
jgi:hypothetical protein